MMFRTLNFRLLFALFTETEIMHAVAYRWQVCNFIEMIILVPNCVGSLKSYLTEFWFQSEMSIETEERYRHFKSFVPIRKDSLSKLYFDSSTGSVFVSASRKERFPINVN